MDELQSYLFREGNCAYAYQFMGAHPVRGGYAFTVWAPNATAVSVVGDFNGWDHTKNPMENDNGIWSTRIAGIKQYATYKYAICGPNGWTLKADPYAFHAETRPKTASKTFDITKYRWKDKKWMAARASFNPYQSPVSIYELHLGSWKLDEQGRLYTYERMADEMVPYVKQMGYTHVELLPVMEHPFDGSWGYQVTGYFAATSRYGDPAGLMKLIDAFHNAGIGVILDWVPAHFPKDTFGLSNFDGTCLYEHLDPRQGMHPHWGTLIYNYGRPQVKNFLISNALFWAEKYHADGIRMDAVASMLYLDYGKNDGEWVANIYGGNENLEAIEFLKHLNSIFKKKHPDALLIAEESTAWPKITGKVEDDGLGFDYKWNMGWMNDFIDYMKKDPIYRSGAHDELTFSMIYAYSEKFLLSLSHDEVVHGKGSLLNKMPGDKEKKMANLRAALGYMMVHPGKKLLFMGQEFAQEREWSEQRELDWNLLEEKDHKEMQDYMKALLKLYKEQPALFEEDYDPDGFEWINVMETEKNMLTFIRRGKKKESTLVVVCNFSALPYEKYQMGVPYSGKYKEIFNSDAKIYGGTGVGNPRVKVSKKEEWDERKNSIMINVAPLAVQIFSYTKNETKKTAKKSGKEAQTPVSKVRKELEQKIEEERVKAEKAQEIVLPKETQKKLETSKKEPEKLETSKTEPHKIETSKKEPEKLETSKTEPHKIETSKKEPEKLETSKKEPHKIETSKKEPEKLETTRKETETPEKSGEKTEERSSEKKPAGSQEEKKPSGKKTGTRSRKTRKKQ